MLIQKMKRRQNVSGILCSVVTICKHDDHRNFKTVTGYNNSFEKMFAVYGCVQPTGWRLIYFDESEKMRKWETGREMLETQAIPVSTFITQW